MSGGAGSDVDVTPADVVSGTVVLSGTLHFSVGCHSGFSVPDEQAMEQGRDAIDALIDYLAVHHYCEKDDDGNLTWTSHRKISGWIVPIATGFHGITELGQAKNQRDPDIPHRFAESIVTLGEFRMPHRIHSLDEILWRYHIDLEKNLYLCQQISQNALNQ